MKMGKDLLLIVLFSLVIFLGFQQGQVFKSLETQELIVRGSEGGSYIKLEGKEGYPILSLMNNAGKALAILTLDDEKTPTLAMKDAKGMSRLLIKGGEVPGIFLKNDQNRTIGSWSLLQDGGAGFGLAYESGIASTIIRGGNNPSIAFYSNGLSPTASFGVSDEVAHIMVCGKVANEGVLLHGGENPGLLVLDDQGELRIHISKHGVLEGKEKAQDKPKVKEKLFTWDEDYQRLFPDREETRESR